jgi:hypothetical protein
MKDCKQRRRKTELPILRNALKTSTDKTKKEYLEGICDEIVEFKRIGRYDLMYMKMKELGLK